MCHSREAFGPGWLGKFDRVADAAGESLVDLPALVRAEDDDALVILDELQEMAGIGIGVPVLAVLSRRCGGEK